MTQPVHILMCPPHHYDVDYVINPWMEGNVHRSSRDRAEEQWNKLYQVLTQYATVDLVKPQQGWPDMVFTANAGLMLGKTVVLSHFFHPERQGEEPHFKRWFEEQGYTVHELPRGLPFEGAGDALLDRGGRWLWAGYGFRSELDSHPYLAEWLDIEVLSLRLTDERFYHLDTCFCPLSDGYLLYYPPAFDAYSNRLIEMRVPAEKRIPISEVDAVNFACNAVDVNKTVVVNQATDELKQRMGEAGFTLVETPLTEFLKAGGAAKCLTLRTTEPIMPSSSSSAAVESRNVKLEGHLLDSGLINRALDSVVKGGGSFQVLNFDLGNQRQDTSVANIRVSAPSHEVMAEIMSQLIDMGAIATASDAEAKLDTVAQNGVAPDDFYVTTIYPTEVRISGNWHRVTGQRMDAAIVVPTAGQPYCALLRDLKEGDRVVVGVEGLRTVRKAESREKRSAEEFSFMGSGVSSERRVEIVVEQIAWDLRRIRDRGGKVVVTAGPVVIHTGGGSHSGQADSRELRERPARGATRSPSTTLSSR